MLQRFARYGLMLTALLVFTMACSATNATAPAATSAPAPAPNAATAVQPSSTAASSNSTSSPIATASSPIAAATTSTSSDAGTRTIQDIVPDKVYKFQVVPAQTQVSYPVHEVLLGNSLTTVGTTNTVEGEFGLVLRDGKPQFDSVKLRVDLRTLKSDNGLRDEALKRQWLESNKYPYAEFVGKEITGYPANPVEGEEIHFQVTGDMTIRNITQSVTFDITAKVEGDRLTGTGTTLLYMKDYGFSAPDIAGRFTVTDGVTLTITGVAKLVES